MSKLLRNAQRLDLSLPHVRQFAGECGLSEHPVSIRLIGLSEQDVRLQLTRLERIYGDSIALTQPRQSGRGAEWIAYGTIKE